MSGWMLRATAISRLIASSFDSPSAVLLLNLAPAGNIARPPAKSIRPGYAMTDANDPVARLKDRIKASGWGVVVDETLSFNQLELRALAEVWRAKAEALNALPRREDLDIRLLKPFLRHVSVLERVVPPPASSYRVRLQGSFLVNYFGDQTGKLMEQSVPPELAERWTGVYDALLEARRPLRLVGTYSQERMGYLIGEAFAVPLGNGNQPPLSVFSATYYTPRHKSRG
jgi:hypothetical protein